jgi:hypothetical protein
VNGADEALPEPVAWAGPAGAAVAGLNAIEVRRNGKPTANAVAFRNPLPRTGLFPVAFTGGYTFLKILAHIYAGLGAGNTMDITDLVNPRDQVLHTVQSDSQI